MCEYCIRLLYDAGCAEKLGNKTAQPQSGFFGFEQNRICNIGFQTSLFLLKFSILSFANNLQSFFYFFTYF